MKNIKSIKTIFWVLVGIFVLLLAYFLIPAFQDRVSFIASSLIILLFLLGGALFFMVWRSDIQGALRKFLLLTGASALGFLISVFLHNAFYALGVVTNSFNEVFSLMGIIHYIMEGLHVVFFLIAIPVCPIVFLIGVVGSIVFLLKKQY
jgi:O-antigen ligase